MNTIYQNDTLTLPIPTNLIGTKAYQERGAEIGQQILDEGNINLAEFFIQLTRAKEMLEGIYKSISEDARDALKPYIGTNFKGAAISQGSLGYVKYDYSRHPDYAALKEKNTREIKNFEAALQVAYKSYSRSIERGEIKDLSNFAQNYHVPGQLIEVVDPESGQLINAFIPEKTIEITKDTIPHKIGEKYQAATIKL